MAKAMMLTDQRDFTYEIISPRSAEELFNFLLNVRNWWMGFYDETINGESLDIGDEFTFLAGGGAHYTKQKLIELIPNQKITWLVTESNLTFLEETNEWDQTKLSFVLEPIGDKTTITFTHEGLEPKIECYDQCSSAWTQYLSKLKHLLK